MLLPLRGGAVRLRNVILIIWNGAESKKKKQAARMWFANREPNAAASSEEWNILAPVRSCPGGHAFGANTSSTQTSGIHFICAALEFHTRKKRKCSLFSRLYIVYAFSCNQTALGCAKNNRLAFPFFSEYSRLTKAPCGTCSSGPNLLEFLKGKGSLMLLHCPATMRKVLF